MTDVSEGIFGTKVTKQGSKGKSETDSATLCDSKHEVWVYTTDYLNDGEVTPGEDNIIVSFVGTDTSGTGCIGAIADGSMKFLTDHDEWADTVDAGYDAVWENADDCSGVGGCAGAYTGAVVYTGIYGVTRGVGYVAGGVGSVASSVWGGISSLWSAEEISHPRYAPVGSEMSSVLTREFRSVTESGQDCFDDLGGTVFHNSNGRGHKVSIKITCDGETIYNTEMAGTDSRTTRGDTMKFDSVNKSFKITKPGTWKVTVESLASHAECGTPTLDKTWTINVSKPANWDEEAPVIETQTEDVKALTGDINTQLQDLGIESDLDPLTIFGGLVVGGGLLTYIMLQLLTPSKEEEPTEE